MLKCVKNPDSPLIAQTGPFLHFSFPVFCHPQNENRPTPENDREGNYCRKSTESAPEWPSVAKFPPLDVSIMPRQIFPRGDRSGEIWHFGEVGGERVAETET
jgi:hypothetical protein